MFLYVYCKRRIYYFWVVLVSYSRWEDDLSYTNNYAVSVDNVSDVFNTARVSRRSCECRYWLPIWVAKELSPSQRFCHTHSLSDTSFPCWWFFPSKLLTGEASSKVTNHMSVLFMFQMASIASSCSKCDRSFCPKALTCCRLPLITIFKVLSINSKELPLILPFFFGVSILAQRPRYKKASWKEQILFFYKIVYARNT